MHMGYKRNTHTDTHTDNMASHNTLFSVTKYVSITLVNIKIN